MSFIVDQTPGTLERGAQGGQWPSCPFLRGARGQECPSNETVYFLNNIKYDIMKLMNLTFKSSKLVTCICRIQKSRGQHDLS